MKSDEPSSCCTPSAHREGAVREARAGGEAGDAKVPMVSLPGGVFRMGTDYDQGFPADGEGPVRPRLPLRKSHDEAVASKLAAK